MEERFRRKKDFSIHYNRLRGDCRGWELWLWNAEERGEGVAVPPSSFDSFGAVFRPDLAALGLEGKKLGMVPRFGDWLAKDGPDRLPECPLGGPVFILEGSAAVYNFPPETGVRLLSARLESRREVKVLFSRPVSAAFISDQDLCLDGGEAAILRPREAVLSGGASYGVTAALVFDGLEKIDYPSLNSGRWKIISSASAAAPLVLGSAVYGDDFKSDLEMGLRAGAGGTSIRVFAPYASAVEALFYEAPSAPLFFSAALKPAGAGLWEGALLRDFSGFYWKLMVSAAGKTVQGLDPYSRSVTAHDGLALIAEDAAPVSPGPVFTASEAVIYELHIRDFTIDACSGVAHKGKYLGLAESGRSHPRFPDLRTGLDHLAELGVNTVQIMPFQDFENDESSHEYNWGYMPVNFNSPDGWYATGLYGNERVRECKAMIDALHKRGFKVIMDVVYNHTAETPGKPFNFDALAMGYYYRLKDDGSRWNGSACGNEFKTEAPMGRKFVVDSLLYWVNEYKVDGFRFDLMGLIDRDTVSVLLERLKAAKPDILVYGEPWASGETPAAGVRKGDQRSLGFAVFNDNLRDALKGGVFDGEDRGFIQAGFNREAVMRGIKGAIDDFADSPLETVNYASCHDNHTLWDRLNLSAPGETAENRIKMHKLAQAVILTSQGLPFLHSGEEFLRTKKGESNSYNSPDEVNRIDWNLKKINHDVFAFYRDLIALRKAHPAFRLRTAEEVRRHLSFYEALPLPVEPPCIAYQLNGAEAGDKWGRIITLINPKKTPQRFVLPVGEYEKGFDESGARAGGRKFSGFVEVPAVSLTVLYK